MECMAIILAGGKGTRISHLIPGLPKPLAIVNGRPFLEWILYYLTKQKIHNIYISTGYLENKIEEFISKYNKKEAKNIRCINEEKPLGTAGGVVNVISSVKDECKNVLILNGDSITLADLAPLYDALQNNSYNIAIFGVKMLNTLRFGTLEIDDKGHLVGFNEKKPGKGIVSSGVYLFNKKYLQDLPKGKDISFELDVIPSLILRGIKIKVIEVQSPFIDIGTEDSLVFASTFIKQNYKYFMEKNVI